MKTHLDDPEGGGIAAPAEPGREESSRATWRERYREVRGLTEALCTPLHTEDYVIQSMPDASPAKWHLAHTSWFFETFVLKPGLAGYRGSDPHYAYLFNSYYNAVGPMHCRAQRGMISRPTVQEVHEYRRQTDEAMEGLIARASAEEWRQVEPIVELGLHHEQQHQELLLTDLKHMFAQNPLRPAYAGPRRTVHAAGPGPVRWRHYEEGVHWIGHEGGGFHFDNESPRHRALAPAFQLADRLVTNREYLAFINDEGYRRPEFWLSLGWMTVRDQKWTAPLYWEQPDGDGWREFTLRGLGELEPEAPVTHVSYLEAEAYARWAGARLPTEVEWEIAAMAEPLRGSFVEARRFHPSPDAGDGDRTAAEAGNGSEPDEAGRDAEAAELRQMFGEAWQWTRSAYSPYPGYAAPAGAIGEYNGKFMCNQYVLRGGSCATARSHFRRTYRNFFPPEKRWQFTGIRLARDVR